MKKCLDVSVIMVWCTCVLFVSLLSGCDGHVPNTIGGSNSFRIHQSNDIGETVNPVREKSLFSRKDNPRSDDHMPNDQLSNNLANSVASSLLDGSAKDCRSDSNSVSQLAPRLRRVSHKSNVILKKMTRWFSFNGMGNSKQRIPDHPAESIEFGFSPTNQSPMHYHEWPNSQQYNKGVYIAKNSDSHDFASYASSVTNDHSTDGSYDVSEQPQLTFLGDSVVIIMQPRELARKQQQFALGGPNKLQVYANFEGVLTKFRNHKGPVPKTSDIVEHVKILKPEATAQLAALVKEFYDKDVNHETLQDFATRSQQIISNVGGLHASALPAIIRETKAQLPLRQGWQEMFGTLVRFGIPSFVFSSGYGDIVTQLLINDAPDAWLIANRLPANIRIISNFFRISPDGFVRAFSTPIIHDVNKNASTAGEVMGFSVPDRPHRLILASSEEDVNLDAGGASRNDVSRITIGFLETTEDLAQKLPAFLKSFDVVLLGDGRFQYPQYLIDNILQVQETRSPLQVASQAVVSKLAGLSELFGKLDLF